VLEKAGGVAGPVGATGLMSVRFSADPWPMPFSKMIAGREGCELTKKVPQAGVVPVAMYWM
jgi:hypothetical protein